ncbi:MAG: ABC-2 family transporter protein [Thermomicrobiales bacterium]|nr:ABC-2 family transporter protein [Thermomicrobiales bacterium]MCO5225173.1 ABC-2 family transporter protein [Thermomicrobiales bacterium]MCO5229420.1 ABC-2 family transporter protein [Thermomicrobiales bacterium]
MQSLFLCWHMATASIRGQMQYRASFVIGVLSGMFFQGLGIIMIWAILDTFSVIGEWSFGEIAMLYGMRLTAHGVYLIFFSSMYSIDDLVREGGFDRLLVRPIHPILQLMFTDFRITVLGDLAGGLAILIAAVNLVDVHWTATNTTLIVLAVIGGAMIDGAFQVLPASLTFRYIESMPARVIFDDMFSRFGNYPVDIFGSIATRLLTFLIPLAFVAWLPVSLLLDKPTFLPPWAGWLSLPVGVVAMAVALWVFVRSSRAYQSSGS